jgi:secreted Zn-dependent insulinase-like peptidase
MKIYTTDCGFGLNTESRLFASVWNGVQEEHMREFNYMADCANLSFNCNALYDNLSFSWSGFNDSMPNYVNETITKLKAMP